MRILISTITLCFFSVLALGVIPSAKASTTYLDAEPYQQNLIQDALLTHHLKPELKPDGKIIDGIVIVPYDVIIAQDPWPNIANVVHRTTQPDVIERELLFKKGANWEPTLIEESGRNLRNYLLLSVAEIIPCESSTSGHVIALVVTKDLWSLRLNWNFLFADSQLENLDVQLAEFNLFGRNKTFGTNYHYDLATSSWGLEYVDPRVSGSRIATTERFDIIGNHLTNTSEGGDVALTLGQPLFSLDSTWAWSTQASYKKDVYRLFSAGALTQVKFSNGDLIPYSYHREDLELKAFVTRSFGHDIKKNISFGYLAFDRNYGLPDLSGPASPSSLSTFAATIIPRSENAGELFISFHFYEARYENTIDVDTYALTETFRFGPDVVLEERLANSSFGLASNFFETLANFGYSEKIQDDLISASLQTSARYQTGVNVSTNWVNETVGLQIKNVSPRFGSFRFFTSAFMTKRFNDLNNGVDSIGGDNLLRGYPSSFFVGSQSLGANFELRTLPVNFKTVYAGLAGFVDVADAYNLGAPLNLYASTGVGLRIVFPQFNRAVLRLDLGFPLQAVPGASPASVVAQFGQAVGF